MKSLSKILSIVILAIAFNMQIHAQTADAAYAVVYVNTAPVAKAEAVATFKRYRDASSREAGYVDIDILEQIGRPTHFSLIETWRDQAALDAHLAATHTQQFLDALKPLRLGAYDQRIYKTLNDTVASIAKNKETIAVVTHVDIGGPQRNAPELLKQFAQISRKQAGNLRFDLMQQNARNNHFTIFELWRDQAAFDAHSASVQTRQFREEITPATGSPIDERIYKVVD